MGEKRERATGGPLPNQLGAALVTHRNYHSLSANTHTSSHVGRAPRDFLTHGPESMLSRPRPSPY
jgi:hypothetical protein